MNSISKFVLTVVISVIGVPVQAASIIWTLNGVTFGDGGTAFGTFDFDADTQSYSNVAITTTSSSAHPGFAYTAGSGNDTEFDSFLFQIPPSNATIYDFEFQSPLTNAGGAINIVTGTSNELFCEDLSCNIILGVRSIQAGFVSAPAVPIPPAVWLFGSALGLLGWLKRRTA